VEDYDGRQVVGMDLHRRRSVLVRMTEDGRRLGTARITAARRLLTLVYYGMRDGQIRCLSRPPATPTAQAA
jgi:DNA-binding MarR family transcriptional regulator